MTLGRVTFALLAGRGGQSDEEQLLTRARMLSNPCAVEKLDAVVSSLRVEATLDHVKIGDRSSSSKGTAFSRAWICQTANPLRVGAPRTFRNVFN